MRTDLRRAAIVFAAAAFAAGADLQALEAPAHHGPYAGSTERAVMTMLREAQVGPDDFVIDLGSGDGRIVRAAARHFGARGLGVEIEDRLVRRSVELAHAEGLADRVRFVRQDIFQTDISAATVVTMYLLPQLVNRIAPKLLTELRPGTRVVAHDYGLAGWVPQRRVEFEDPEKVAVSGEPRTVVYVYVVPARAEGVWSVEPPSPLAVRTFRLELKQEFDRVTGQAWLDGGPSRLADVELLGGRLSFRLVGRDGRFSAEVRGDRLEGLFLTDGVTVPWRAQRRR